MSDSDNDFYNEDIVAKFASLSIFFYEFLEIEYAEAQCHKIFQAAMGELGHSNLDIKKLNRSYDYYIFRVDLDANPAAEIDCPGFEKYFVS